MTTNFVVFKLVTLRQFFWNLLVTRSNLNFWIFVKSSLILFSYHYTILIKLINYFLCTRKVQYNNCNKNNHNKLHGHNSLIVIREIGLIQFCSHIVGCQGVEQLRGSSARFFLVGPPQVKARKSIHKIIYHAAQKREHSTKHFHFLSLLLLLLLLIDCKYDQTDVFHWSTSTRMSTRLRFSTGRRSTSG